MNFFDPGISNDLNLRPELTLADNFTMLLASKRTIDLKEVLKKGPLLLIFIRGTWCPFCRMHMARLRSWIDKMKNHTVTIIVVSSESPEKINKWLRDNPVNYLFASDESLSLAKYFGVHLDPNTFANAATFLIDIDRTIRLAYKGKRTNEYFDLLNNTTSNATSKK